MTRLIVAVLIAASALFRQTRLPNAASDTAISRESFDSSSHASPQDLWITTPSTTLFIPSLTDTSQYRLVIWIGPDMVCKVDTNGHWIMPKGKEACKRGIVETMPGRKEKI